MTYLPISSCRMSPFEFEQRLHAFDVAVESTEGISTFCSGSDWILAANETLHSARSMHLWERDDHWMACAMGELTPFTRVLQPLEMTWAFGCPLVGADISSRISLLLDVMREPNLFWQVVMLTGVPEDSVFWRELQQRLSGYYSYEVFEGAHCIQSEIHDGPEDFLKRRSTKFRANLRRSDRQAASQGLEYDWVTDFSDPYRLFERMMAVERNSWKYNTGRSIFLIGRYRAFYEALLHRLATNNRLRLLFAQWNGQDVGYVYGGVLNNVYRGFQLSYDDNFSSLSLGHLVQWHMIQKLAEEGVNLYDLGMVMDYKKRWADRTLRLLNVVIFSSYT